MRWVWLGIGLVACGTVATSPQEVSLSRGQTKRVAGGAAEVLFAGADIGAVLEITCKGEAEHKTLELVPGGDYASGEACGVSVTALSVQSGRVRLRTAWQ